MDSRYPGPQLTEAVVVHHDHLAKAILEAWRPRLPVIAIPADDPIWSQHHMWFCPDEA